MSMMIFEESTVFKPSDYGLKVGDIIQVVCVGGGAGGSSGAAPGGAAGEGGKSCTYTYVEEYTYTEYPEYGDPYEVTRYRKYLEYVNNPGGGGSGRGYGAGGGGGGGGFYEYVPGASSYYGPTYSYSAGGAGGGAGKVRVATVLIKTLDPIVITIGEGGEANMPGGATSFGEYITASGGNVGEGAQLPEGSSGKLTRSGSNSEYRWADDVPDSIELTGGGGGEGGYVIGLPLGGKFDHNRKQMHAIGASGNTGGNGLSAVCAVNLESNEILYGGGLTIDAPETVTESTVVERGGCGGVYADGESVGIGHGVCIVTW